LVTKATNYQEKTSNLPQNLWKTFELIAPSFLTDCYNLPLSKNERKSREIQDWNFMFTIVNFVFPSLMIMDFATFHYPNTLIYAGLAYAITKAGSYLTKKSAINLAKNQFAS
jgi:hypothetical protein